MNTTNPVNLDLSSNLADNLSAHIAIINDEGIIIDTNAAWSAFDQNCQIARPETDSNYFKMLQQAVEMGNDYALKLILGIKKVFRGEQEAFSLTYPVLKTEESLWFKVTIQSCNEKEQVIIIQEDVSSSIDDQKGKDRYQMQFEQSMDGILITDAQGQVVDANPAASRILGWSVEELKNCTRSDIMDVQDPKYRQALEDRKKSGTYQLDMNLNCESGNQIPAEVSSRFFRNKSGNLRAVVSFRDISLRKQAERNLGKTKQFTESALNSIPGIFFVLNRDEQLVRWNSNMIDSLGYKEEELADITELDFIVDDQREKMHSKIKECLENGKTSVEIKVHTKDGTIKDFAIQANRFKEDDKLYLVCTGIDITKAKQVEHENRKNELMLQQLFDNSPVGIAIVDNENKIQRVNDNFEEIFGYSKEEAEKQDINKLLAPEDKIEEAEALSMATRSGESLKAETIRTDKNDEEVPVLIGSVPVELKDEIIAIYGLYVDISQQHHYQQEIKKSLNEKETILAELHHRVKNNLALIAGMIDLQLFESEDGHHQKELTDIKKRIQTIASIHEVLYENGNLSNIPFNIFLDHIMKTDAIQEHIDSNDTVINIDSPEISLDINQSIPCGLFLNEILSLIFEFTDSSSKNVLDIRLREYDKQIHLAVETDHPMNTEAIKNHQSLHRILVDTLVDQLNGTLLWPNSEQDDNQKFEFIFTKKKYQGPAQEIIGKN
ncbi:PAS domain-containing sensor histidine kinase [Fodinibius salinus]|nr:PAS domain S-box protein [Fodinibius salinus]